MSWPLPENPFVGLRPFETEETLLFFGRHEQTRELLRQLHKTRFLAVVGSSGCGKSSLIRAGLIPKLLGGFLVEDRDAWLVAKMKPGEAPLLHLAEAILVATGQIADRAADSPLAAAIPDRGLAGLLEHLAPHLENSNANLLLLVDQFEEIFRFSAFSRAPQQREEAAQFVAIMLGLAEQRQFPIYVAMTMRSDYLGDCDAFLGLPEAMNHSQFLVPRLTRQQRREAIKGPVRLYQGGISDRLTDRLLNETGETRDDLPILQHALMRTWDHAHKNAGAAGDGTLDLEHYEAIGTVKGALSQHAEEALEGTDERARSLAKQLFQALTEVDPGNRRIRRPAKLSEIEAITGAGRDEIWRIILRFRSEGRSFLVLSSENPDDDPLIDISHESLIRQWERLNRWVDEEVESADIYRRLSETARLHRQGKAGYYRDPDLQIAVKWNEERQPNQAWAERYNPDLEGARKFLDDSIAEQARTRRDELDKANKLAKERGRRNIILGVALVIVIISSVAVLALWRQARISGDQLEKTNKTLATANEQLASANEQLADANEQFASANEELDIKNERINELNQALQQKLDIYKEALSGITADHADSLLNTDLKLALLLGAQAYNQANTPQARKVLLDGLQRGLTQSGKSLGSVLSADEGSIGMLVFRPDGTILASGAGDGSVGFWRINDQGKLVPRSPELGQVHNGEVLDLVFNRDGTELATWAADGWAKIFDVDSGRQIRSVNLPDQPKIADLSIFSDSSQTIVNEIPDNGTSQTTSGDLPAYINNIYPLGIDVSRWQQEVDWTKVKDLGVAFAFIRASTQDRNSGEYYTDPSFHQNWEESRQAGLLRGAYHFFYPQFDPKSQVNYFYEVVSGTGDLGELPPVLDIEDNRAGVPPGVFQSNIKLALEETERLFGKRPIISTRATFWNNYIGDPSWASAYPLWIFHPGESLEHPWDNDPESLFRPQSWDDWTFWLFSADKNKLGQTFGVASSDIDLNYFNGTLEELALFSALGNPPSPLEPEPTIGETRFVLGVEDEDGSISLLDIGTENYFRTVLHAPAVARNIIFAPEGNIIAIVHEDLDDADRYTVEVVEAISGKSLFSHSGLPLVGTMEFSPFGDLLTAGMETGEIYVWNSTTGELIQRFEGFNSGIQSAAIAPNGRILASGHEDGGVHLWDIDSGEEFGELLQDQNAEISALVFSPDGKYLVAGDVQGNIVVWDSDPESWVRLACEFAGRNLTTEEWNRHVGGDYRATCPQYPIESPTGTPAPSQ